MDVYAMLVDAALIVMKGMAGLGVIFVIITIIEWLCPKDGHLPAEYKEKIIIDSLQRQIDDYRKEIKAGSHDWVYLQDRIDELEDELKSRNSRT